MPVFDRMVLLCSVAQPWIFNIQKTLSSQHKSPSWRNVQCCFEESSGTVEVLTLTTCAGRSVRGSGEAAVTLLGEAVLVLSLWQQPQSRCRLLWCTWGAWFSAPGGKKCRKTASESLPRVCLNTGKPKDAEPDMCDLTAALRGVSVRLEWTR